MKIKLNLETLVYGAVILLCLAVVLLIVASRFQFTNVKPVYQGF
jgi:capsular polysaccharide biosynthesis protein